MKKFSLFALMLILFNIILYSQNTIIYEEQFNQENSTWNKNKNKYSYIKNGVLVLTSEKDDALRTSWMQIFINYKQNFSIETKIRQTKGDKSQGYGLIWGAKGWEDSYYFIISSSGFYNIGHYYGSKYREIKEWTAHSAIKPINNYNVLKIEKNEGNIVFYINDVAVYTTFFRAFNGQMHGFLLQKSIEVEADYLIVTNEKPALEIADVSFKGEKKNIGGNINTSTTELAPIISPDGKTLFFGRGYHPDNFNGSNDEADIWYSELQPDGTWSKAKNIGPPLNNKGVNVVVNVMPDGNTLFLEGLYNSDGTFRSDQGISISHKTEKGWAVPTPVRIDNFYNKNIYETYFFTSDQSVLLMSIERDDSFGDKDLYISFRKQDGSYTEPKNMGAVINTFADEGTPFMAPDGRTLYFSSDGHRGYGSNDIFMSKRLDNSWLRWSKPKNLGPSINTGDWDTYLSLSARGDTAFLVSTSNSYGNEDIFIIAISEEMQPDPVVLVFGKVLDEKTKKPIGANISYQDLATGKEVGIAQSDPKTGDYKIVLPYGKLYAFRAEAKDYIARNENLDLKKKNQYVEIKRDLFLTKMAVGEVVILNNVFFEQANAILISTSYPELDRIVKIMKDNPKMKIELMGHTDNRGNAEELMKLSEERVKTVKDYMVKKGINENRIKTSAFGGTKTIHKNDSEEERSKNRRVEFKILEL